MPRVDLGIFTVLRDLEAADVTCRCARSVFVGQQRKETAGPDVARAVSRRGQSGNVLTAAVCSPLGAAACATGIVWLGRCDGLCSLCWSDVAFMLLSLV